MNSIESSAECIVVEVACAAAAGLPGAGGRNDCPMTGKVSLIIERDEHGCCAWRPELEGRQSQGKTVEETPANVREPIGLYRETSLPGDSDQRSR